MLFDADLERFSPAGALDLRDAARGMIRAFSPCRFLGRSTQGVALGWYEAAPLALDKPVARRRRNHHPRLLQEVEFFDGLGGINHG